MLLLKCIKKDQVNKYLKESNNIIGGSFTDQEKSLLPLIEPMFSDIRSLLSQEHILGISIFQINENIYILIGERHHKLKKDMAKSFARFYGGINHIKIIYNIKVYFFNF